MNNLIIHKIVIYLRRPRIAKLFFFFSDYRRLINSSNYHYDELFDLYGNKKWENINKLRSVQSMFRFKIPYFDSVDPMNLAAKNGHLEIVKWLHESGGICTTFAMDLAAYNGHLEIVKWLHENRQEGCTKNAMDYAALTDNLKIIKWLHENRNEGCSEWAMNFAASYNRFEIVKWLYENRKEGRLDQAMHFAALNGHLEMVKWFERKLLLVN